MPIKLETVVVIATFAILREVIEIRPLKKKFNTVASAFFEVYEENQLLKEKVKYLLHVLEENDVELDDFDLIALMDNVPSRD